MVFEIVIREMCEGDPPIISAAFRAQDWHNPVSQYERYLQDSRSGRRLVLVAECCEEFAGYLTIVWRSTYPPFYEKGIPEIVDFNVLKKYWRRRIGTALMDRAETCILSRSEVAGIGVGLTADYGAAQILYLKRGYILDGHGLFQRGRHLAYGDQARVDDDLVLYLTKRLR